MASTRMPANYSNLVHFLGLGAQRAGSTSLHALLRGHPQLHLPRRKELHYFSKHYAQGKAWYRAQFQEARSGQKLGEITPYYLYHSFAPQRIHAEAPEARLIILLRDPIERVLSHYLHSRRLGFERLPLGMALDAEAGRLAGADAALAKPGGLHFAHQEQSYVARSRYHEQVERYYRYFPACQVLMLQSELMFANPSRICQQITDFLDIDPHPQPNALPRMGGTRPFSLSAGTQSRLRAALAQTYAVMARRYGMVWP